MELVFLGTAAGGPTLIRSASSVALRLSAHSRGSRTWLFDCGEGTYRQLLSTAVSHAAIERIFISHLHGDHLWGLPGVVVSALLETSKRRKDVHVVGPEGTYDFLNAALNLSRFAPPKCGSKVRVSELGASQGRLRPRGFVDNEMTWCHPSVVREGVGDVVDGVATVVDDETHLVRAARIRHTPSVDCFGFVVEEKRGKRRVDAARATALGLPPGEQYKELILVASFLLFDLWLLAACLSRARVGSFWFFQV